MVSVCPCPSGTSIRLDDADIHVVCELSRVTAIDRLSALL